MFNKREKRGHRSAQKRKQDLLHPDRALLKEILGRQNTYREEKYKCCGRALIKAAG